MTPMFIILSALILSSSSVFAIDTVGEVYAAIRHEDVERVKAGLSADTNAVSFVVEKQFTMLHIAAEHSSSKGTQILELLLANGANVEAKNHRGQTPLFSAVIYDNAEGTQILIAHGANVNVDSSRFIMGRDLAFRRRKGCECGSSESCGNLGRQL